MSRHELFALLQLDPERATMSDAVMLVAGLLDDAQRVRAAARKACRRLRREREEARDNFDVLKIRRAFDAAREELEACKWLLHPKQSDLVLFDSQTGLPYRFVFGGVQEWQNYADAARAVGWPGT